MLPLSQREEESAVENAFEAHALDALGDEGLGEVGGRGLFAVDEQIEVNDLGISFVGRSVGVRVF